jgi:hypothetical protein
MVQNHVTWGENTVNVFNTPATGTASTLPKSPSLFGPSPTSAPTTSAFASPAASTPSAFSFSTTPVKTPQTASPGFGGTATSTGFFSPTTTAPTTSTFAQQQQQQQKPMSYSLGAPQQAAIQAHMNATLHQESLRLESKLLQLHAAYSPYQPQTQPQAPVYGLAPSAQPATATNTTCRFQHIFYDLMTPAQRMEKISLGIGNYPQKPHHIPIEVWNQALSQNPNPDEYIPVLITSAEGLHSRLVSQQTKMKLLNSYLDKLQDVIHQRQEGNKKTEMKLNVFIKQNLGLKRKLMSIMQKVDLCRGKNVPLQPAESELKRKLQGLVLNICKLGQLLENVKSEGEAYQTQLILLEQERRPLGFKRNQNGGGNDGIILDDGSKREFHNFLNQHSDAIEELRKVVKKDERDLGIIKNNLSSNNRYS